VASPYPLMKPSLMGRPIEFDFLQYRLSQASFFSLAPPTTLTGNERLAMDPFLPTESRHPFPLPPGFLLLDSMIPFLTLLPRSLSLLLQLVPGGVSCLVRASVLYMAIRLHKFQSSPLPNPSSPLCFFSGLRNESLAPSSFVPFILGCTESYFPLKVFLVERLCKAPFFFAMRVS